MSDVATKQQRINEGKQLPQNSSTVPMPKVQPPKAEAARQQASRTPRK
jgi:hypothetical protein